MKMALLAYFQIIPIVVENINLIFLQPYCPDLNPIEDVWRKIKSTIYKSIYENLNELIEIFKREYYKIVDLTSFYKNWVKEYLGINI
ncbi:transposase [Methanobrevibacter oralis]|uniref:transposase n=1 Tax=Methanobrevibacter oralis TaxID=66851 RepID=UPI003144F2F5